MADPYATDADPQARAELMAQVLRRQQGQPLQQANEQAHGLDMMAVAAAMSNNPALEKAATLASSNRQKQFKPTAMGHQGFALPATGDFVPSPMFTEEQASQRASREQIAEQNRQAQLQRTMEVVAQRREAEASRAVLKQALIAAGRESRGAKDAAKGAAAEIKLGADLDKRINKLTTTLDKAGVPEFENSLRLVDEVFTKHKGDIPGYGRLGSLAPDFLTSDEGVQARQKMQQAANVLLKSRSGAAVTNSEMQRFLTEVSMGKLMSADALRSGWENVRRTFESKKANLLAGVNPEDLDEYNSRTGSSYSHGGSKPKPASGAGKAPAGVFQAEWDHMDAEDRKLWKN